MKRLLILILAALLTGVASVQAVEPAGLIDQNLERRPIQFVGLSGGQLSFFDTDRRLRHEPAADYVSLRLAGAGDDANAPEQGNDAAAPPEAEATDDDSHLLELTDGHILRGRFAGADDAGRLLWDTDRFGQLRFSLDDIVRFALTDAAPPAEAGQPGAAVEDRVTLRNGDAAAGFIETLTLDGLVLRVDQQELTLAWDTIARVELPSPMRREPGVWLRLTDGVHLRIEQADFNGETLTGEAFDGQKVELAGSALRAIDFAQRHQLVRIGDLEPALISGGHVFGVPMPPQLIGDQARLHAPLELQFDLPAGSRRFAADAALDPDDLEWADLELILADGEGELLTKHLNADQPEAAINVAPRGGTLIIRLREAANGPIRDRLTLDRAVLLVEIE